MAQISKAQARALYAEMLPKAKALAAQVAENARMVKRYKSERLPQEFVGLLTEIKRFDEVFEMLRKYAFGVSYECSACDAIVLTKSETCPACKARMDYGYQTPDVPGGGGAPQRGQPAIRDGENRKPNFPDATSGLGDRSVSDLLDGETDHVGNPRRKSLMDLHRESMAKRGRSNSAKRAARIQ